MNWRESEAKALRKQMNEERTQYQERAAAQEAMITELQDRLAAAEADAINAWGLAPKPEQLSQIKARISFVVNDISDGIQVIARCCFRGHTSEAGAVIMTATSSDLDRDSRISTMKKDLFNALVSDQSAHHNLRDLGL